MRLLRAATWIALACLAGILALLARSATMRFLLALLVALAVINTFRTLFLIRRDDL